MSEGDEGGPRPVAFLVAGDPATATGGFLYARRMIEGLRDAGMLVAVIELPDRFPQGDDVALNSAGRAIASLAEGTLVIVDGLAFATLAPLLRRRRDIVAVPLIHHPLCEETGLTAAERRRWFDAEQAALSSPRHVLVSSETTRRRLGDFGVDADRISVVKPGVDPPRLRHLTRRAARLATPCLLSVATLVPRKGQDLLITALKGLERRPWRLHLVGVARDPRYARRLRLLVARTGLGDRVSLLGEVPPRRLERLFAAADLFVLPSHHEGFGIALVEAIAHGVPVLTTSAGAIPEAVPRGPAVFVPAGRVPALRDALAKLLSADRRNLRGLQGRAAAAAPQCRSWRQAAAEFADVVAGLRGAP